ncbi:unnamed protein product [Pleuronectes platessa]|uniref:Uncharacterized protein n=1 Tax=Pleuronectes platessa TaxID=8262 RepID=A0A9N7ZEV4_PLEPL|nr:unnamed protein product [Pleuronectes platessa]
MVHTRTGNHKVTKQDGWGRGWLVSRLTSLGGKRRWKRKDSSHLPSPQPLLPGALEYDSPSILLPFSAPSSLKLWAEDRTKYTETDGDEEEGITLGGGGANREQGKAIRNGRGVEKTNSKKKL